MTDKEINGKVATLCGWMRIETGFGSQWSEKDGKLQPPNYADDLNACREFMSQINGADRDDFCIIVQTLERVEQTYEFKFWWALLTMTPRELCECYLKLKGQWE